MISESINRTISPSDEMYRYARSRIASDARARAYYFDTGRELAGGLEKFLRGAGLDPKRLDLLDFAAGYGRVTRRLAPMFASVTATDLDQEMIDFQRREFGVEGFVSPLDPRPLTDHGRDYDVVFVFSLFTHLPERMWRAWLASLAALVRSGGHVVFSTHSYELFAGLDPARFGDPAGWVDEFLFWETNETGGRLQTAAYGCTIVKDSFVRAAVAGLAGCEVARRYRKGEFHRYHDIYAVRCRAGA